MLPGGDTCALLSTPLVIVIIITIIIVIVIIVVVVVIIVIFIISATEILFLPEFACLFVYVQVYAKSYERITMKFSGSVRGGTRKNHEDFGNYR